MTRPSPQEPEILAFIGEVESLSPADAVDAPMAQQRQWYDALCRAFDAPLPEGIAPRDETTARSDGQVPLRRYHPAAGAGEAMIVYFHGGGFVFGGLDSHHTVCAEIAAAAGAELLAVDYRLAPEHRFPLALLDCLAAVMAQAPRPVVVAGDSAGASLAAGVALVLRDAARGRPAATALLEACGSQAGATPPPVLGQALIYPLLGGDLATGSYSEMAEAPGLTTGKLRYYRAAIGAPEGDPYGHPLTADQLGGLAPAYITSAFFDPLRDDGRHYAARLAAAGVAVTYREEPQMIHAWLRARHRSPGAASAFAALCRGIRGLLDAV